MFPPGAEELASGSEGVSRSALFTSPGGAGGFMLEEGLLYVPMCSNSLSPSYSLHGLRFLHNSRSLSLSRSLHVVMSVGNQQIGIPRKYQHQIGIWYIRPKFLDIFLVFYRYFENTNVKIW